jgi:hypothetical protein
VAARLRSISVFDGSLKRSPCMMHCIVLHHRVPPGTYLGLAYYDNLIHTPLQALSSSKTSASWEDSRDSERPDYPGTLRASSGHRYSEFQYGLKSHTLPLVSWSYPLRQHLSFLLFSYSINIDIHLLIIETYMSRNQSRLRRWILVPPYNVSGLLSIDVSGIIA